MAGISQQIPNYSRGMSEQPDQLKTPGQVKNIVNGIPDVTYGLFKRPGSKRMGTNPLANVQSGGSWFHYYRDETEGSYIGQVDSTGNVRVWKASGENAGAEMTVKYGDENNEKTAITTYLTPSPSSDTEDIQALTINDTTFLNNRSIAVKHSATNTDARPDTHFAYIELIRSENGRQYGLNLYNNDEVQSYSTATGIKIKSDNLGEGVRSGDCAGIGTQVFNPSSTVKVGDKEAQEKLSFVLNTKYNNDDDLFTSNGRVQEWLDAGNSFQHSGEGLDEEHHKEEFFLDVSRTNYRSADNGWSLDNLTESPNNSNKDVNVYYKLRNKVTGVTCISAKVVNTSGKYRSGEDDQTLTATDALADIVTAFSNAVAHEDLDIGGTTPYHIQNNMNYSPDRIITEGVPEGKSVAYGDLPFVISSDGAQLLLTYKDAGSIVANQWELTRCNNGAATHLSELNHVRTTESGFTTENQTSGGYTGEAYTSRFNFHYANIYRDNFGGYASISLSTSSGRHHRYARLKDTDTGKGLDRPNTPVVQSQLVEQGYKEGDITKKNLIFRITTLGQLSTVESKSTEYQCTYNREITLLHGGESFTTGDTVDVVLDQAKGGAIDDGTSTEGDPATATYNTDATYTVEVTDHELVSFKSNIKAVRPVPTPFDSDTAVTTDAILGSIQAEIESLKINGYRLNNRVIGNGLYLSCEQPFNVSIVEKDLMRVMQGSINDVTELPNQCRHGYIVKVANARMSDEDDYYLKFNGDNEKDGSGSWSECAEPGIVKSFDASTMPHVIQRTSIANQGTSSEIATFTVKPFTWEDRLVGDDNTNPVPTFVSVLDGHPKYKGTDDNRFINKVLFFRNRLAFLSGENVILCKPGTLGKPDFWSETALTVSSVDPIDIACSSTFPSALYDGIEVNTGLLAFSTNQQFLLSSDDTVLNPDTAKLRSISTYNYNSIIPPISLGTTVGYIDNSGKYSRFNQMANITREGEPIVIEESKLVPTLLEKGIDLITNSRENQIVLFGKAGTDTVVGFRYFISGEKRLQGAWFKWKFNDTLKYHFIINDEYFYLDEDNFLQKMSLIQSNDDLSVDKDDVNYQIHLDNYVTDISGGVFNIYNNTTTFSKDWISKVTSKSTTDLLADGLTIASGGSFSNGNLSFSISTNLVEDTLERTAYSVKGLDKNVLCTGSYDTATTFTPKQIGFGLSENPPKGFKGIGYDASTIQSDNVEGEVKRLIDFGWYVSSSNCLIRYNPFPSEPSSNITIAFATTSVVNASKRTNVEQLDIYDPANDVFKITYDGNYIRWYQNDKEKHRMARNVGSKLYFDSIFNTLEAVAGEKVPEYKLKIDEFSSICMRFTTTLNSGHATAHSLSTGDAVQFFENGHTVGNLTDDTTYYVVKSDDNSFFLTNSYADSISGDSSTYIDYTSGASTDAACYFVTHETMALKNVTFTDLVTDTRRLAITDGTGRYAVGSLDGNNVTVSGDWTTTPNEFNNSISGYALGYLYDYQVDFPTIYPTNTQGEISRADVNSSLTVHRLNFNFGKVGSYETTLTRLGKDPYTEIYESTDTNLYEASDVPYLEEAIKTIPVYERNKNVDITLKSTSPTPATLHSMSWEGDFSSKYYKRV